jgi:hypothetical protein
MRVFISYSTTDGLAVAKLLHTSLHAHGHDAFLIEHDAGAGANIWDTIAKECLSRDKTIFVITNSSLKSRGQKKEYDLVNCHYLSAFAFINSEIDHHAVFSTFPYLKACKNPDFTSTTLEQDCNKLAIDLVRLQDAGDKKDPNFTEVNIPTLSIQELDNTEIDKSIKNLNIGFQSSTIVPEVSKTQTITGNDIKTTNLGFVIRLPIDWFKPKREDICNDPLFTDLGRDISLAERAYLDHTITKNADVSIIEGGLSKDNLVRAFEKLKGSGFEADLIFPTIQDYMDMHHLKDVNVEYTHDNTQFINSFLTADKYRIGIVTPIGNMPSKTIIFSKQAMTWHARPSKEYGALHISMGLDRLYPLKFVEVIAIEMVDCKINGKGIVKITEKT